MRKHVVIVTHSNDNPSIENVSQSIKDAGLVPFRFDTDKYPTEYLLQADFSNGLSQHTLVSPSGESVSSEQIHAIWYRRFYAGKDIDSEMEKQMRSACLEETKRCLLGFLTCTDCFQVDDYWKVKKASNKDYQLKVARDLGFDLPNTLVTNCENRARAFYDQHPAGIITKMQTAFAVWQDGVEQVVFTSEVEDHHLEKLDGLRQSPMVFQEKIEKQLELRATVVGKQVFCAAIDSNAHDNMGTDWRKRGADTLDQWFAYELPEKIQDQLVLLTQRLGIHYGAVDIILTPDNRYKFLEINPCGEFYWMDHFTGLGICHSIAELLTAG